MNRNRRQSRFQGRAIAVAVSVVALLAVMGPGPADAAGIPLTVINNCPNLTVWMRGENPPNVGDVMLPNSNQSIGPGQQWSSTLPIPWVSGRVWACPSDTTGKHAWTTDGNFFTYGCSYFEPTTGTDPQGVNFVNLDPSYIAGIWLPLEIKRKGGTCQGQPCVATCKAKPTKADIQEQCATKCFWSKYNPDLCLGMSPTCDPGLGAGCLSNTWCQASWFEAQLKVCEADYPACKEAFTKKLPSAFQIYGCGNEYSWFGGGFGQHVCAALNRGVVGEQSEWKDPTKFYPTGVNANEYAAWIHNGLGCRAYAFSWDDTDSHQGGDMTYRDPNNDLEVIVTLCPWDTLPKARPAKDQRRQARESSNLR